MSCRGRGVLGALSDFDAIDMKFDMEVEFDALKDYPNFGCNKLISCPVGAPAKNSANPLPLRAR